MQREGVFREMKLRGHYEKPSERRVREKAEAIRRALSPKATGAAF
jgi:small subunit ribosomal protein S21